MKHNQHTNQPAKTTSLARTMRMIGMAMLCMVICLGILSSCSKDPVDEPEIPQVVTKRRTVLVYMVANNSLNSYGKQDRQEMLKAANEGAIPQDCDMLIYYIDYTTKPSLYRVSRADSLEHLVYYTSSLSSVSAQRMLEVIDDVKRISPAEEYGMVLWSHASGWYEDGLNDYNSSNNSSSRSGDITPYSFGSTASSETMNISTLAKVLEGQDMDFLYFDCCFMASAESLYELRNCTKQVYASAAEMHVDGSRWDLCMRDLFTPGKADLVKAAERNFEYYDSRLGSDRTLTVSVTNMEYMQELGDICAKIYEAAPSPFVPSGYSVQNYGYAAAYRNAFYDLTDYITVLSRENPELLAQYEEVMNKVIAYKAATPYLFGGLKVDSHSGLSVNIITCPGDADIKNYCNLQWFTDVTQKLKY